MRLQFIQKKSSLRIQIIGACYFLNLINISYLSKKKKNLIYPIVVENI